jgi:hypothetical protein
MFRKTLCLAATALFVQAASADVLYTWQQVEHSASMPDGLHLELVFTDAAVAKGTLALDVVNQCWQGYCVQQQDSLLALRYWYAGADGTRQWNHIDYGYGDETRFGLDRLSMVLEFLPGGQLSGSIFANDGYSDFYMKSEGAVFTMLSAHSDEFNGCGYAHPSCAAERGLLGSAANSRAPVLPEASPVPEPAAPAMLAIGALAGWLARRRSGAALSRKKR